ncbi:50S ribosomal protein L11 methyltransferase [Flavobacteriaceae bacterium]|nr:50S ribosomal protein L11 methyltransferase [Flavobacteriaceae bacterium]MDA9330598.1 50S ribosomal protein L11 methyltransferase [Flavobacteriaceae bacterium]MDA9984451.1 50S ribosomal protein L11 methyltransferase [Flavobacteriaceae bacterium]MDB2672918.1 50S ribosomal protein L11 methyltransferase [Flavobacteriaceae bacterium]MDB9821394.1 50S ribosomal protein L11 methyltransferase [Flavobacteriaceae bacterium]
MATTYIQLKLTISPLESGQEIALAFLGEMGFESFVETTEGLEAYIQEESWTPDLLDQLYPLVENGLDIGWSLTAIPPENWNAVWESDFQPILIEDKCAVRAHFHAPIDVPFELVITPKMSFGTGHHQTTHMMLNTLLNNPPKDEVVLDMGCGTGVLAILAEKLGAVSIDAIDVESWCFENTVENAAMNDCKKVNAIEGDRQLIPEKEYGTIIANINLNVLLLDIPLYAERLRSNGKLFLSGFYTHDIPAIESKANQNGLQMVDYQQKDNWVAAHFYKK